MNRERAPQPQRRCTRTGTEGRRGRDYRGNFRTGIVTQGEPRRIKILYSMIPAFGEKMRRISAQSFAVGGYFYLRPVARRKEAAQLARFSSIWLATVTNKY